MSKIYVFAKLSKFDCLSVRLGGAGLGNLLFTWARATIFAKKNNYPMINTTWKSLKVGPLIRGELDTRGYSDLFEEKSLSSVQKFFKLMTYKRIKEDAQVSVEKNTIIVFEGMKNEMEDIKNDQSLVKEELLKIVRKKHLDAIKDYSGKGITVHIRMGDFYTPSSEDEIRANRKNCRLPIEWYIHTIEKIRNKVNSNVPVNIFSDAKDSEIEQILNLPNVTRYYFGSSIADMLAISKSQLLIASNSTFSLWGSYLGQMPTIWFPGTLRIQLFDNPLKEIEIDYDDELPRTLLSELNI